MTYFSPDLKTRLEIAFSGCSPVYRVPSVSSSLIHSGSVMKLFYRFSSVCLLVFSIPSWGDSPPRLRVDDLVSETIKSNPERLFYEAALQGARAELSTAGRLPQPEVHGTAGAKRSRDFQSGLSGEGVAWSVGVSQTFEWPGRLSLRKAIANLEVELAELGYQRFVHALGNRVRLLALTLSGSQERSEVASKVANRLHELRETLLQRDPAGVTPILEVRILEATELTLRKRAAEARLSEDSARVELNLLRGQPTGAEMEVVAEIPILGEIPPVDVLLSSAETNNFDLRSRTAELKQQGFRIDLARNERWPAFTVGPQFSEENSLGQDRLAGVAVSFPLPLWKNPANNVAAAQARRLQAETLLAVSRRDIERRVVNSLHSWQAKKTELENWRPDSVEQFRAASELADRHFRLGAVPATTYVEIQRQYFEAVDTLLNTRREVLENVLELEQLTGMDLTHSLPGKP